MTDDPINLDGRGSAAERHDIEMRRQPANGLPPLVPSAQPHLGSLEDQMLAEPARTWGEVMEKWWFLLERYRQLPMPMMNAFRNSSGGPLMGGDGFFRFQSFARRRVQ